MTSRGLCSVRAPELWIFHPFIKDGTFGCCVPVPVGVPRCLPWDLLDFILLVAAGPYRRFSCLVKPAEDIVDNFFFFFFFFFSGAEIKAAVDLLISYKRELAEAKGEPFEEPSQGKKKGKKKGKGGGGGGNGGGVRFFILFFLFIFVGDF